MNSKERVFGALQGKPLDRPPFTAMLSLYGARLTRCPLKEYYTHAAAYAAGQTAVLETFHPDILFSPFSLVALTEAFGGQVKYFDNQPPNLLRPAIASAEDIPDLDLPDIDTHPRLIYVREGLRQVAQSHGKKTVITGILLSPVDLPLLIMGIEGWLETVLFDEVGKKKMLDITIPFFIQYANALLNDGADALALPAAFLTPAVSNREIITEFAIPVLKEVFAEIKGPIILHHVGSPFLKFLDLFKGLPNVTAYALDHKDNLLLARETVDPGLTLLAGPDGPNIGKGTPREIENQCMTFLKDRKDDPHFILSTSGGDVGFNTPPDNIHAMRNAVAAFETQRSN